MENLNFVETGHALLDVGSGLLRRIYFYKNKLLNLETAPLCLVDPAFEEVHVVLLGEYPDYDPVHPPVGVKNMGVFCSHAGDIYNQMKPLRDLLIDVADFRSNADRAIPVMLSTIHEWHLEVNRSLLFLLFEMIATYVRVLTLLATVEDLALQISMLDAASKEVNPVDLNEWREDVKRLLMYVMTPQASLATNFEQVSSRIGPAFSALGEIMEEAGNVHKLTHGGALDVMAQLRDMNRPAQLAISEKLNLDIYRHIMYADKYHEWVLLTVVICPSLLRHKSNFEIFQREARKCVVVEIFRDLSLNVHSEFKMLMKNENDKPPGVTRVVKDPARFAKVLKKLAREANQNSSETRRSNRCHLLAQLRLLNHFMEACPALVGPKLPFAGTNSSPSRNQTVGCFPLIKTLPCLRRPASPKKYFHFEDLLTLYL